MLQFHHVLEIGIAALEQIVAIAVQLQGFAQTFFQRAGAPVADGLVRPLAGRHVENAECAFDAPAHPTLPSRLTSSSFFASTANSIGSSRNTDLQKPSTIID